MTVLGDIGPWADSLFLAGGLAPRYLVGGLAQGARPHVGTTDVDFIVTLAVAGSGAYRTLVNNLKRADFTPGGAGRLPAGSGRGRSSVHTSLPKWLILSGTVRGLRGVEGVRGSWDRYYWQIGFAGRGAAGGGRIGPAATRGVGTGVG